MDPYVLMTLEVIITAILSIEVYKLHCLSKSGALASLVVGVLLAYFGTINAFFMVTFFVIVSFFATMKDIDKKIAMGLQEGQLGERTWKNVAAVGFPPVLLTILQYYWPIDETAYIVAFLTSLAVAGSDTVASEIGVKDPKAYMITTLKPVSPGVNGGVSKLGMIVSVISAFGIAFLGWVVMTGTIQWVILLPFLFGLFGNLLDSLFGELFENKGLISKYTNNWSTELISAVLAGCVWIFVFS